MLGQVYDAKRSRHFPSHIEQSQNHNYIDKTPFINTNLTQYANNILVTMILAFMFF